MRRPASWRKRAVLAAAGLLVLDAAVYGAYTLPRTLQERSVAERVEIVRADVERERQRIEVTRQRAETMRANAQDVSRFYAALGTKESLLSVREEIARAAAQRGLRVGARTYAFEPIKGAADVMRFEMRMALTGSYGELAAFLDGVERSPHFVAVDEIRIGQRGPGEPSELAVVLSAFYRAPTEAGGTR